MNTSFKFPSTRITEVERTVLSLEDKKSLTSYYSNKNLKFICMLVSRLLKTFFEKNSFTTGCFPKSLITALVVSNNIYLPFSKLPVFSKIFERIVHNLFQKYLDPFELYDSSQFGLHLICQTQTVKVLDSV